jgi:hypothetical protein
MRLPPTPERRETHSVRPVSPTGFAPNPSQTVPLRFFERNRAPAEPRQDQYSTRPNLSIAWVAPNQKIRQLLKTNQIEANKLVNDKNQPNPAANPRSDGHWFALHQANFRRAGRERTEVRLDSRRFLGFMSAN